MKNSILLFISILSLSLVLSSCFEEDEVGPVIGSSEDFVSAELTNAATGDPLVLDPDLADEVLETYEWSRSDFGVQIPTSYRLEMDVTGGDFSSPAVITSSSGTSAEVTVDQFNDALLNLGLAADEEATVDIRVSTISQVDTLYSSLITRSATPYRLSDCGQFCAMGIIGDATPGGWDNDTDMRLVDPTGTDKSTWARTLYLTEGNVKFRANDNWDVNWGSNDFPSGTGEINGPDMPVSTAGYYKVTFNDLSGEFNFELLDPATYGSIGLVGDATPEGWDVDTELTQDPDDPHVWTGTITFGDGFAKFRANGNWDNNWGSEGFPSGHAVHNGSDIPVSAGTYSIYFNDATGQYMFMNDANVYGSVGVIGDATANGWDSDTDLIKDPMNPYMYSGFITLADGLAKFRANDAWDDNWGGSNFPEGVGSKGGADIGVTSGTYFVTFNSGTGEYKFLK